MYYGKMDDVLEIGLDDVNFKKLNQITVILDPKFSSLLETDNSREKISKYKCTLSLADNVLYLSIGSDIAQPIKQFHDNGSTLKFIQDLFNGRRGIPLNSRELFPNSHSKINLKQFVNTNGLSVISPFFEVLNTSTVLLAPTTELSPDELKVLLKKIKEKNRYKFKTYLE